MRHLKIYRAIRLIVREGSIRGGAEALAISPSALNRSIQAFEEEMNVAVFERIPSGVRLSVAGELLLDVIDRHLTEFDDLQNQLNELRDGLRGTLRISVGSDLNAGLVPAALVQFEQEFPGVSVAMETDDTTDGLHRRAVDLALLTNPVTDDAVEVVFSQPVPLTAWRRAKDTSTPITGLWNLVEERLLLPPQSTGSRAIFGHRLRRSRLAERVTSVLTAAQVFQRPHGGNSICVFPEIIHAPDPDDATIERLNLPLGDVQFTVLRSTRIPLTRSAQAFGTILQRKLDDALPPLEIEGITKP